MTTIASLAAGAFAASDAGYFLSLLVSVLLALHLRKSSVDTKHRARVDDELRRQSESLAVLVQQALDERPILLRVPDLETATAELRTRLDGHVRDYDRHIAWADQENHRIRDKYGEGNRR